jgi:cyclopropane-fatty-acyl-phospholipid synthase
MDGWWDCEKPDEFFHRILSAHLDRKVKHNRQILLRLLMVKLFNMQSRKRAFNIGEKHYDTGNDLFESMLDKRMVYSCAYWKDAHSLDEAQENKLDLICRKLGLRKGMRILDIGCGWGSFAGYAAGKYGVEVVGITVSKEQVELGKTVCKGLPVEIRMQDYRDIDDTFDHVVSLGMIEHVGYKNYRNYMRVVHRCLKDNGLFLLHTIGGNRSMHSTDPWINKYIFPDGMLPSIKQIGTAIEGLFIMEDWHNFSADYDKTLISWHKNFTENRERLKSKYDNSMANSTFQKRCSGRLYIYTIATRNRYLST